MKKYVILAALFLMLAGIIFVQKQRIKSFRQENGRLNNNLETLLEKEEVYRVRDSLHAIGRNALELKVGEYERYRTEDARLIADLQVKLRRAESVSKQAMESQYEITATVRDTMIIYQSEPDTARYFSHRTPYIDLEGILRNDRVDVQLQTYDTLFQVVHRIPRKFLFIRYGTKAVRQEVVSSNPHTRITYTEYIRLIK